MSPATEPRRAGPALVTTLTDGGGAPARHVYGVHPGAMPVDGWRGLAAALPAGTAVHVLSLDALPAYALAAATGAEPPTLGELAARVRAVLPADPAVPYALVGWSFGGVVAHAAATATPGPAPDRLVLLDSIAPVPAFTVDDETLVDGDTLVRWFAMYLCAKRGGELPPGVCLRATTEAARLRRLLDWCTESGTLPAGTPEVGFAKLYRTFLGGLARNNRIVRGHRPAPAGVPVTLVKPVRSLLPDHGPLGWPALAPRGLRLLACPGDHYTMLRTPSTWRLAADALTGHPAARTTPDTTPDRPEPAPVS